MYTRERRGGAVASPAKDRCDFYDVPPVDVCRVGLTTVLERICACGCVWVCVCVMVGVCACDFCLIKYQLYTSVAPLVRGREIASLFVLSHTHIYYIQIYLVMPAV